MNVTKNQSPPINRGGNNPISRAQKESTLTTEIYQDNNSNKDICSSMFSNNFNPNNVIALTNNRLNSQLGNNHALRCNMVSKNYEDTQKLNFKIEIKYRNIYINDSSTESYDILCTTDKGVSKGLRLSSNELNTESWITSKLGASFVFTGNYKKYFKPMFEESLNGAKIRKISHFTGWHSFNGSYRYFHASGTIPELNSQTEIACGPIEYDFNRNSILSNNQYLIEYFFSMLDIANQRHYEITLPLLLYQPLAILKHFFKLSGYEPEFCLFIIGKSGSGKTTIAELFSCIFNRNNTKVNCNFNDTMASIEVKANTLKDAVMIVDDFYPSMGKDKQEQNQKLERIDRMYGDGKGKSRTNISLETTKELEGKGMCLITGELESENLSTQIRYLGINVDSESINFTEISKYQRNKLEYNDFFYLFFHWVSQNNEYIMSIITSEFETIRTQCEEAIKSYKRQSTIATFFIVTRIILTEYIKAVLHPEHNIIKFLNNEADNYIIRAVRIHLLNTIHTTPEFLFIEGLNELLVTQELKVFDKNCKVTKTTKFHGYEDNDNYYLIPETVKSHVYEFWEKRGKCINYSKNTLYKKLADLGVIEVYNSNGSIRNTKNYRFNGKTSRYLVIKKYIFEQVLNSM